MTTRACRVQHGSTQLNLDSVNTTAPVSILDSSIQPGQAFVITSLRSALSSPSRALVIPTLHFFPQSRIQFTTLAQPQRSVRVAWSVIACRVGLNVSTVEFIDSASINDGPIDFSVVRAFTGTPAAYVRAVQAMPTLKPHSFVVAHVIGEGVAINEDEMFCIKPDYEALQVEATYLRSTPHAFRLRAQVITWEAVASNDVYDGNGIDLSEPPVNSVLFSSACVTGFINGPMPLSTSGFFTFTLGDAGSNSPASPAQLPEPQFASQENLGSAIANPNLHRRVVLQTVVFNSAVKVKYQLLQIGSNVNTMIGATSFSSVDSLPVLMATHGLCPSASLTTSIGPSLLLHVTWDILVSNMSRLAASREDDSLNVRCPIAVIDLSGLLAPAPTIPSNTINTISRSTISMVSASSLPTASSTSTPPSMLSSTMTTASFAMTTATTSLALTTSSLAPTTTPLAPDSTLSNTSATTALFAPSTSAASSFDAAMIGGIVGGSALALILLIVTVACLVARRNKARRLDGAAVPLESDIIASPVVGIGSSSVGTASTSSQYEFLPKGPNSRASAAEEAYGIGDLTT